MIFSYFVRKRFSKDKCTFKHTFCLLKTSKKLYEVFFFDYVKVCIFWKSIQYTTD